MKNETLSAAIDNAIAARKAAKLAREIARVAMQRADELEAAAEVAVGLSRSLAMEGSK